MGENIKEIKVKVSLDTKKLRKQLSALSDLSNVLKEIDEESEAGEDEYTADVVMSSDEFIKLKKEAEKNG